MVTAGRLALALDELLCKLTSEQLAALHAAVPPWFLDQADAAARDVRENWQAHHLAGGIEQFVGLPTADYPEWVRLGVTDTLATWWLGRHTACMHDPHPMRPQPVHSAAWKPGLVVCARCAHLLAIPRNSATDRTCDGCGRVVAGVDDGDPMYPFAVNAGVLTYAVGACDDCRFWEDS
jgi:hypothetical protein